MDKIKKIEIVFENCDAVVIFPDMFKYLVIDGITKEYRINCFQYNMGEFIEYINCKCFTITINKKGLNQVSSMSMVSKEKLKERLKILDITHIKIFFSDKKSDYISVPWKSDDNGFSNLNQKNKYIEDDLQITICR
jgi:hypothetical protein